MKIWIFCPVYLDAVSFVRLHQNIMAEFSKLPRFADASLKFIVIDDSGGLDSEINQLTPLPFTEVLTVPFNLGHQRALVYGLRKKAANIADTDLVVTLDSDGEDKPEDLPRLIAQLLTEKENLKKIILARRTGRRESLSFKALYFCFKLMFRALTGVIIKTGNYAVFRGWLSKNILFHPHFDLCYSSALLSLNLDVSYLPCEKGVRYSGQSRMGYMRLLIHGFRMLMPFLDKISVRALVAFSVIFITSTVTTLGLLAAKLFSNYPTPHWISYFLIILAILSFIVLENFIIIFAIFSQSQGLSLREIENLPSSSESLTKNFTKKDFLTET